MATSAQTTANQANAQLSTGPRTDAGKARSAMNATRHGFAAQTVLLAGEEPAEYESLFLEMAASFPTMAIFALERSVREMVNAEWRLRRARQHQELLLNDKIAELQKENPAALPLRLQLEAMESLTETSQTFKLLLRYETKFENQYNRAQRDYFNYLKTLEKLATPAPNRVRSEIAKSPAATQSQTPRNAPCPCGSGEKYKRCCGKSAPPVLFPNS